MQQTLETLLKLFAPVMPHIAEEISQQLFADAGGYRSIHRAAWPVPDAALHDAEAERPGAARLGLGTAITRLVIASEEAALRSMLEQCATDVQSMARAGALVVVAAPGDGFEAVAAGLWMLVEAVTQPQPPNEFGV